ncbi:SixA phosphatase family protein [Pseudoroseicyclus tamaricis]|uniref:Histidine phosphatase family protein n=1 Tax=Pseudoroseicyclus tamaricis TaxID=2705421 RepID=A0A6B2JV72_9RHOB|nr:histidine phosphatase family protein [Pseudoroseicyclus tamaricis]NDV02238.1 histidine phosphatase family protein [Pseudoroseicyclus tamaricis]
MKTLILTRHAKSDWSQDADDHSRPLNKRGRRAAPLLGQWLQQTGHLPDLVLCSDAKRTRETLALILAEWASWPPVRQRKSLYQASAARILEILRGETTAQTIQVIAHNPGIGALAQALLAERGDHPRFDDYPTGATAVISFQTDDWAKVAEGTGRLVDFTVPAELG